MTAGESSGALALIAEMSPTLDRLLAPLKAEPASAIDLARQVIADLSAKYEITDPTQAHRLVRERPTQGEYDAYRVALEILDGNGAIG